MAIDGGPPALSAAAPCWPPADEAIRAALESAYRDGSWGRYHGPHCDRLAQALGEIHQTQFVALCCSGTFAVELALRGLKIGAGDEVILAAYDFAGNFRAIEAVGARPVLVDIDPDTWCLDAAQLSAAVGDATRAVVVSHLHGGLADMRSIMQLAAARPLRVIEDACQAPGAKVDGRMAGTWGDAGVLSFGGSKLLTAGRGGAVLTPHADVQQRLKIFCDRGNQAFPLSELQAAVLIPQLARLADRNAQRSANVERLQAKTRGLPGLQPLVNHVPGMPSYYKLAWLYQPEALGGRTIEQFVAAVRAEGAPLDTGFRGFVRRTERRCRRIGDLTHSQRAAAATVLLHHPILLEPAETIDRVAGALEKVTTAWAC